MHLLRRFLTEETGGQAMVEFALAFPLQLFILFGIMQGALLYVSTLVVNYTAFRCARAEIVGEGSSIDEGNGMTGLDRVAQTLLAPLAHTDVFPTDPRHQTAYIPGSRWGAIEGSDAAATKVRVAARDADGHADIVTVTVEWNQELIFPIVDSLFAILMQIGGQDEPANSVYGKEDTNTANWRDSDMPKAGDPWIVRRFTDPNHPGHTLTHVAIVRECSLYRGQAFYGTETP